VSPPHPASQAVASTTGSARNAGQSRRFITP
jgi:hypothetical protein